MTTLTLSTVPPTVAEHRARLKKVQADGGQIAYVDEGPRDGGPLGGQVIVLVHGIPTNSWLWRKIIPPLAASGLRVIAPDLLGFGASDKPTDLEQYTLEKQAKRILTLMDKLGIQRWTQVAHDRGGPWTWEIVDRAPERLQRLIILNTTAYRDGFAPPTIAKVMGTPLGPILLGLMSGRIVGPTIMASRLKQLTGHPEVIDAATVEGYWLPLNEGATGPLRQGDFDHLSAQFERYQAALRRLNVPGLIIWGKRDPLLNYVKLPEQFARDLRIPRERIHILDDASHFLQEDKADDIAQRILKFVQET